MLERTLVVANGKGGVGKTSISANVAGAAARAGWRTLAVDLDPQGNLGRDLGYIDRDGDDHGQGLLTSVLAGTAPSPLRDVRASLDVLCGGDHLDTLAATLAAERVRKPESIDRLGYALGRIASDYDLLVLDCPPQTGALQDAALAAARWVLIPTSADAASIDGLAKLGRTVAQLDRANLEVLGVALFDLPASARAVERETRAELAELLGDRIPVFAAVIHSQVRAARDTREAGQLAWEYERGDAAERLASDYEALAREVLTALSPTPVAEEVAG